MAERNYLIAVDQSDFSKAAFEWFASHLYRPGDLVHLIHVWEAPIEPAFFDIEGAVFIDEPTMSKVVEGAQNAAIQCVQRFVDACKERNMEFKTHVIRGDAREGIVDVAERIGANAVIVGSHGYGTIKRLVLGSVSSYVANHCHRPVIIVRKDDVKAE